MPRLFRIYKGDIFIIFLCLFLTGGFTYIYLARANPSAQVQFTADTIVSLAGISDGDLYVASSSECTSLDVSSSTLTVSSIPDGSNFTLKTPSHNNALSLTPSGGGLDLTFDSSNLSSDNITQWTLDSSTADTEVSHIVGVEKANTYYEVQVDGSALNSYQSNSSGEITFNYTDGFSSKTFTVSEDTTAPTSFSLTSPTDGNGISDQSPTFSWNASTDPDLDHYELYLDGSQTGGNLSNTSYTSGNLSCNSHNWYVKAVDKAGNSTQSSTFSFTVRCGIALPPSAFQPPTLPEGGFKVLINNGAESTTKREVTLSLNGGSDVKRMAISNNPEFEGRGSTGQISYQSPYNWDLCQGRKQCPDGPYTVYVKLYTKWGQSSAVLSDSITLKTTEKPVTKMTVKELKAKIKELKARIAQLRAKLQQLLGRKGLETPTGYKFNTNLRYGQKSKQVRYLQICLKSQGSEIYPEGIVSGWFGTLTKKAVIRFQEKYASDVLAPWNLTKGTGFVGKTTRAKLNEVCGE